MTKNAYQATSVDPANFPMCKSIFSKIKINTYEWPWDFSVPSPAHINGRDDSGWNDHSDNHGAGERVYSILQPEERF